MVWLLRRLGQKSVRERQVILRALQRFRREQTEGMWKDLVRRVWKQVPAVWGADAEP